MQTRTVTRMFLVLATLAASAFAQSPLVDDTSALRSAVRREGTGSTVPDHIAFYALANFVKQRHLKDPEFALERLQHDLKINSRTVAASVLEGLIAASDAMKSESKQSTRDLLCGTGASVSREQTYQRLDALDDLRELSTQRRYLLLLSTLDTTASEKLQSYVRETKEGIYYVTSNHKVAFESGSGDVIAVVSQMCAE